MRVSVFGLGYVGSVSAAEFAADGHDVIGVDVNPDKVAAVNAGRSPIVEPGLEALLADGVAQKRIRATADTEDAVNGSDLSLSCKDDKLNLSPYYLKPGFAFGGSCLPKDVRALQYRAKEVDLDMPMINSVLDSNQLQVQHAVDRVVDSGRKKVGLFGFSFKAGTDDLRESPMVVLAEALLGKGYQLCIYDRNVSLARLVGANRTYINEQIPHLSQHLCESLDEVIEKSELIVVGNGAPEFVEGVYRCRPDQTVIDLVRLPLDFSRVTAEYDGICW